MRERNARRGDRKDGPTRSSVISRESAPRNALLRLSLDSEGRPFVDVLGRAPGRGAYVEPSRTRLEASLSPKALARTFKGKAVAPAPGEIPGILEDTVRRVEARLVELLTLAKRAGQVELGLDAALECVREGGGDPVVFVASDLSARALERLRTSLSGVLRVLPLGKSEIGARLGRGEVGVIAVRRSVFAERVRFEAERLGGLRDSSTNDAEKGKVRPRRTPGPRESSPAAHEVRSGGPTMTREND